ncbi:Tat pathway signal protein [Paenarthrobacter ureafaciens]|uniref:Tat pathway signal protein n=1 Tax=Paenarthrobacter ureafaciens TaxID=37931 RepID=UPI001C2BC05D|nr:Tat pathway signal protein [Paenarthrobacter ureafaciens]UOD80375.1 Tat pathway signal protein [Paenarthrobacter ureafaciens]WNZ03028.1 Tat pathway signal protein [Paenarthrobacter ureafaciens]
MDPQDSPDGTGANAGDGRGNGDPGTGRNQPKPPPWQVPKPELHPGLAQPPQGNPGQGKPGQGKGQNQDAPGGFLPVVNPFEKEREREAHREAARKKRSQRRTVVVGLGVTALLAGTITAIVASNEAEADYAQVCFNEETGERVNDDQCNNSSSAGRSSGVYAWYFYSRGASVPAVGQNRSSYPSYTKTAPQGAKTSKGYSTKGGTVSRGGFGSSSKSGSSGG